MSAGNTENTRLQRHREYKITEHRDTENKILQSTETQRIQDYRAQGHRQYKITKHRDTENTILQNTETQRI